MTLSKHTTYRYSLRGGKKFKCPKCGKNTLVKYFDIKQSSYLNSDAGRCDRESSCGYWKKLSGEVEVILESGKNEIEKPIKYIAENILKESIDVYHQNGFTSFIQRVIPSRVNDVSKMYNIGSHSTFGGSVIFWYINYKGQITRGKVMAYDSSGKRVKIPYNKTTSMHKVLGYKNYSLDRCFYGEHLLKEHPESPVAVVESEKTAIIAAALIPKYIWLASGGKSYLSDKIIHVLRDRTVVLFPDSDAYDDWSKKAHKYGYKVSEIVKNRIVDTGVDIADLLIRDLAPPSSMSIVIRSRCFTDIMGRSIELIGIKDLGRCSDRFHERGKICKACMFNSEHYLKIDGELQQRAFTHREVLDLQQVY